jgi:hypothetical protein
MGAFQIVVNPTYNLPESKRHLPERKRHLQLDIVLFYRMSIPVQPVGDLPDVKFFLQHFHHVNFLCANPYRYVDIYDLYMMRRYEGTVQKYAELC